MSQRSIAWIALFAAVAFLACAGNDCPSGSHADSLVCHLRPDSGPDVGDASDRSDVPIDAGCHADTDCATGLHCDPSSHACVACVTDDHCGAGMRCDPSSHHCVLGCSPGGTCPGGQTCCNAMCVDTQTNASNCGSCGTVCTGGPGAAGVCTAGHCALDCASSHADCDGVASTGCEADTTTDPLHCGSCSTPCSAPAHSNATCTGGVCGFDCLPGYADCNHMASDGCEVDLNTDSAHCGACDTDCRPATCNGSGSCGTCIPDAPCSTGNPCDTGTIQCTSSGPVCGNAVHLPAGRACGAGMVCDGAGTCIACVQDAACTPTGSPCTLGRTECSSGAPVCVPTGMAPPGTTCGTAMVCSGAGVCIPCDGGSGCSVTGQPCRTGTISCATGAAVCVATGNTAAGTSCGTNLVCNGAGDCVDCATGMACAPAGNPCQTGALSCTTGAPVCDRTGDVPAGTSCGSGMVCNGTGTCIVCAAGTSCTPTGMPCRTGAIACSSGAPVCVPGGNVAAGMSCGSGMVCDGAGSCVTCNAGASCTLTGQPCRTAAIDCSSGGPVCAATGNVSAGTTCGTGMVCDGAGACVPCATGNACSPGGDVCHTGVIACTTGAPVCTSTGNAPAGTVCGSQQVCNGSGMCITCRTGMGCTVAGQPCATGAISCSTGAEVCVPTGLVPAGTTCGSNMVCDAAGTCNACTSGASCTVTGYPCRLASISCTTGTPVCILGGNTPAGTNCGTNMVCNGSGACVACTAGTSCVPGGNPCHAGAISCATGAAVCTVTGNAPASTLCNDGVSTTCNDHCSGTGTCIAGTCGSGQVCFASSCCTPACTAGCSTTSYSNGCGGSCPATAACCSDLDCGINEACSGGSCVPTCYGNGASCTSGGQCCSGNCVMTDPGYVENCCVSGPIPMGPCNSSGGCDNPAWTCGPYCGAVATYQCQ